MGSPFPIPLNAIRAIEIVARRGALAPAAEELGVTPGAVSQHIRRAEERLGVALFSRTQQGLRPTPALLAVLPQMRAGFAGLQDAMAGLMVAESPILTLTVGSVFASRWLIWRLGGFSALHPEIELRLVVTGAMMDLSPGDIDCAIRYGTGRWDDVDTLPLGGGRYRPVVAPDLAASLNDPADLANLPVIGDRTSMLSWPAWFAASGTPMPTLHGPSYDDPALAFDAAASGQGVLLAVDLMSADARRHGRLVDPFGIAVKDWLGYWFATPRGRRVPAKVAAFRDWLTMRIAEEGDA
ncbi:LysR family transcriptional regulator [Arsenicitalea aurantiaca]|uniref:LysR family transcriptional regulator n=1 Tax=Arsenicitalea aurantiaca TaxID=1783274 RepID=A0A433X8H4_9HYPH|nr:LysR substrate-binding domain-containing protein [Arsenicitalea aurantiaca]RUT30366.1 LysR family transcriptional regulator [Arsenicitalea aurantiaca]